MTANEREETISLLNFSHQPSAFSSGVSHQPSALCLGTAFSASALQAARRDHHHEKYPQHLKRSDLPYPPNA